MGSTNSKIQAYGKTVR
jgi:Asp-tRNA(Asn)/Glu-tRNA(Gln) amidotransferase A subunit family amidase